MEKEKWIVWHFVLKTVDGAWTGCKAIYLDGGNCRTEQGVRRLLQWINEIHRWGLCEYALGCEDDIKHILSRAPNNVRVSGVGIGDQYDVASSYGSSGPSSGREHEGDVVRLSVPSLQADVASRCGCCC